MDLFEGDLPMSIDPATTAVLLIEFQNEFTSEGGAMYGAVGPVMEKTGTLENTTRVAEAARAAGATVLHAPLAFAPGFTEVTDHPYGILEAVVNGPAFVRGTWGAAFDDRFQPHDGDIVVEGKRGLDVFATTNLDFILRGRGISTLAIAGFMTNVCVESTMRTGYEHGYQVVTLTDCVATTSIEAQENAIAFDYPMYSKPMTSTELIAQLS
jgi:ureidoacrylate peracid hydrolase